MIFLGKNWCGTGWVCTGECYQLSVTSYQLSVKLSMAAVHWVCLWCFQSSVTQSQQHRQVWARCRETAITYPGYSFSCTRCCHHYLLSGTWETGESQQSSRWILPVLGCHCPVWLSPFHLKKENWSWLQWKVHCSRSCHQLAPFTVEMLSWSLSF